VHIAPAAGTDEQIDGVGSDLGQMIRDFRLDVIERGQATLTSFVVMYT
jgi:hypothetical protein